MAAEEDPVTLQNRMLRTYIHVRVGIGIIGAALPFLLSGGEAIRDALVEHKGLLDSLRGSMSAYYYASMGDVFVGALVSVGVFLFLYKGFSTAEDWALNLGGACAVAVGLIPMNDPASKGAAVHGTLHNIFAVALFLCIAFVAIVCAPDTLSLMPDEGRRRKFQNVYRLLGIGMGVSPLLAVVLAYAIEPGRPWRLLKLLVETLAILIFAAYWLVKSKELSETDAERLAVTGKLRSVRDGERRKTPGRLVRIDVV